MVKIGSLDGGTMSIPDRRRMRREICRKNGRKGGSQSDSVRRLKNNFKEVKAVLEGMLRPSRFEKEQEEHSEVHRLLEELEESTSDGSDERISNWKAIRNVRAGIELAMMMQAYKRCGVGSIAAFYYLLGDYDFKLLGQIGTKLLTKKIIDESKHSHITYAQQINIKPFVTEGMAEVKESVGCEEVRCVREVRVGGIEECLGGVPEVELVGEWSRV